MTREKIHHLPERHLSRYEKDQNNDRLRKTIGKVALTAAGALLLSAVAANLVGCSEEEPTMLDKSVTEITLEPGARIRSEHYVPNEYDPNNIIDFLHENESISVPNDGDIQTYDDGVNGTWYGIPEQKYESAANASGTDDSDGTVWVNQQRVEVSPPSTK